MSPLSPEAARTRRKCKFCFTHCLVCLGDCTREFAACSSHALCVPCLTEYLVDQCIGVKSSATQKLGRVPCPCGKGKFQARCLPSPLRTILLEGTKRRPTNAASTFKRCPVDVAVESILTLRCPYEDCGRAFVDFDACAAVMCECNRWFCALCLKQLQGYEKAHAHVNTCELNPGRSYYVPMAKWNEVQRRQRLRQLGTFVEGITRDSKSLAYGVGITTVILGHTDFTMRQCGYLLWVCLRAWFCLAWSRVLFTISRVVAFEAGN